MDETLLDNKEDNEQGIPSSGTSEIEDSTTTEDGKVQTSEPSTEDTGTELVTMLEHYESVETHLDNLTTIAICILLGVGLLFGAFAVKSFFDFLR